MCLESRYLAIQQPSARREFLKTSQCHGNSLKRFVTTRSCAVRCPILLEKRLKRSKPLKRMATRLAAPLKSLPGEYLLGLVRTPAGIRVWTDGWLKLSCASTPSKPLRLEKACGSPIRRVLERTTKLPTITNSAASIT